MLMKKFNFFHYFFPQVSALCHNISMGNGNNQYKMYDFSDEKVMQIQRYYDDGHSMRDVVKKFGTSICKLYSLRDKGRLNLHHTKEQSKEIGKRKREGFKHTEKTKKILSEKRKKWIKENPDKSPYIMAHKSRGETFAERYFREWLEKEQIAFQQEYHFDLYAFDFLVNERIDLEIDGGQHRNDKRIIKHDEKRDAKSKDAGFIVYRIFWSDYQKLSQEEKEKFLGELKDFLLDISSPIPEFVIKKYNINGQNDKNQIQKEIDPRKYEALELLKSGLSYCSVGKHFGVSDNAIRKWIKFLGENPKDYGNRSKKNKQN